MVEHAARNRSPRSYAILFHLGGAVAEIDEDATAYTHRSATHSLNINAVCLPDESHGADEIRWTRDFSAAVAPHATGMSVNFLDHDDLDRRRAAYGTRGYQRLAALRNRYDPARIISPPPLTVPAAAPR